MEKNYEGDAARIRRLSGMLNSEGLELTVSFMEYLISTGRYTPSNAGSFSLSGHGTAAGDFARGAWQEYRSGWQE